ncbi:hypothetical protein GRX03_11075 [Halovenus sp. WSH3]|uniref:Uncharacterized protein n=1 Tax=Halovenus carboxidivorans TaxID=2692199 RepID=A0A6B0TG26_9EURY|nr:hypothetical protein [Halovenus carboxidivorans]MXR52139.1 hypothetical protein [Halovenus carboxidivorans]
MGQGRLGDVSSETTDSEAGATATDTYISPLADFLLFFTLTVVAAAAMVVLL